MAFVSVLRNDYVDNKDEWMNRSIDRYLDGIVGWTAEYGMSDPDKTGNVWQVLANILWAASEYGRYGIQAQMVVRTHGS